MDAEGRRGTAQKRVRGGHVQGIADAGSGGAEFKVTWDYAGADKKDYRWTTGLYDNYQSDGTIKAKPFYEIDNSGRKDNPLGSFQYDDSHYFDKPAAPWPNSSFDAYSFLSQADSKTRTLTL